MTLVRDDQLPRGAGTIEHEVPALAAASVLVLRGEPFEVLLMRRHERSTFVPGAWVFPGGVVEEQDRKIAADFGGGELLTARVCAARELFEESGIWIGGPLGESVECRKRLLDDQSGFAEIAELCRPELDRLVWTARWLTPVGIPKRYDTWFFLLRVEDRTEATPDEMEGTDLAWLRPSDALARHRDGELPLVFPTIRNLEAIASWSSADELIDSRRNATIDITRPVLLVEQGRKRIVLPEDS